MKVLVVPGSEIVGGSEITAIDLAGGMRDRGHDVVVYAKPGGTTDLARAQGLRVVPARHPRRMRPSPLAVRNLWHVLRTERPDLVHAYEGYSCTEAFVATLHPRTPLIGTIYTMYVDTYVPTGFPIVVGTEALRHEQAERRHSSVQLLLPPVDVDSIHKGQDNGFRRSQGVRDDDLLAVMVSRLDFEQKIDGLSDAIRAVSSMAGTGASGQTRLIIVGDGPASTVLQQMAARLTPPDGRPVVTFTGWMSDPRPAYQAADVVLGMGTSILRGMATGKPCVLVSEQGHVNTIRPDTAPLYLQQGFWGVGTGTSGLEKLVRALVEVGTMKAEERAALGEFGRRLVVQNFSLDGALTQLDAMYSGATAWRAPRRHVVGQALTTVPKVLRYKVHHRLPSVRRQHRALRTDNDDAVRAS